MAINFPDFPSVGDTLVSGGQTRQWNGSVWVSVSSAVTIQVVTDSVISSLVDSAPGTLDTLNELADALGDDENFASTVTTALSGKALTVHSHAISEVTSLQTSLDSRKLETTYSIAADTTLVAGGRYAVDTSAARILTLPAGPAVGDEVWIIDSTNQAETFNITVNNGGSLINGASDTLVIDVNAAIASLVYTGSTLGWRI
jgi:hypothetical protein